MTKLGEGAFAEVFGSQQEDKSRLALKVHVVIINFIQSVKVTFSLLF